VSDKHKLYRVLSGRVTPLNHVDCFLKWQLLPAEVQERSSEGSQPGETGKLTVTDVAKPDYTEVVAWTLPMCYLFSQTRSRLYFWHKG